MDPGIWLFIAIFVASFIPLIGLFGVVFAFALLSSLTPETSAY